MSIANGHKERTTEATTLWRVVFGDQRGILHLTAVKPGPDGKWIQDTRKEMNLTYPARARDAAEWALARSDDGLDVYHCAHLLTTARPRKPGGSGRVKENAAPVASLYAELDGPKLPTGEHEPSCVVESSPGRYHAYWPLTDAVPPEIGERLNKRLAAAIGADPSGFDLTQLLRVPGTHNHKYDAAPTVRIVQEDTGKRFVPGELEARLPPEEHEQENNSRPEGAVSGEAGGDPHKPPPVALGAGALAVWRGERPKLKEGGSVDRSASIFEVGRVLVRAGLHPVWLVPVLAERDRAFGWNTYTERPGEYTRIARKLAEHGEDDFVTPEGTTYTYGYGSYDGRRRVRPVSLAGRDTPKPQGWHVAGLVPQGFTTTFYGEGGIAKSLVVLHMLMSVAFEGVDYWHGRKIGTCPVLLLDHEMDERTQLSRAKRIAAGAGWPDVPRGFEYVAAVDYAPEDVFAYAVEWLEGLDSGIVGIDSYGFAMAGEAEKSGDVLRFHRDYIAPIHAAGGTSVAVDHIPRPQRGERAGDKDPFGSVYKTNAARSVINATGYKDGPGAVALTLAHRKINVGPKVEPFGLRVVFDGAEGPITFERTEAEERPSFATPTAEDRLLEAFEEGAEMTIAEAATLLDLPEQTARNAVTRLKRARLIEETGEKRERASVLRAAQ